MSDSDQNTKKMSNKINAQSERRKGVSHTERKMLKKRRGNRK